MKLETHYHYRFMAYDESQKMPNGQETLQFPVEVTVINCSTEAEAIKEVKKITIRKNYYLKDSWECSSCIRLENERQDTKDSQEKQILNQEKQGQVQMVYLKAMLGAAKGNP